MENTKRIVFLEFVPAIRFLAGTDEKIQVVYLKYLSDEMKKIIKSGPLLGRDVPAISCEWIMTGMGSRRRIVAVTYINVDPRNPVESYQEDIIRLLQEASLNVEADDSGLAIGPISILDDDPEKDIAERGIWDEDESNLILEEKDSYEALDLVEASLELGSVAFYPILVDFRHA